MGTYDEGEWDDPYAISSYGEVVRYVVEPDRESHAWWLYVLLAVTAFLSWTWWNDRPIVFSQSFATEPVVVIRGAAMAQESEPSAAFTGTLATPPGQHSVLLAAEDIKLTGADIDAALAEYGSPAEGTGGDWVRLGKQYGIDPGYALAFFVIESTAGTAQGWAGWKGDGSSTHNIGNIICAGYPTCYGRFRDYGSWQEGIEDWYKLISVEYVGGRGVHTIEEIIPIYAPAFENDVPQYVEGVRRLHAGK